MANGELGELIGGYYFILILSGGVFAFFLILILFAGQRDFAEIQRTSVKYFQNASEKSPHVYSITVYIERKYVWGGCSDFMVRMRGSDRDSPMILYRDLDESLIYSGSNVNLGVVLPFDIGAVEEIDLACDNDLAEEGKPLLCISDVYVRRLESPKWEYNACHSFEDWIQEISTKQGANAAVRTWVAVDSITSNAPGSGVIGVRGHRLGQSEIIRARNLSVSFLMAEEEKWQKGKSVARFQALHYLWSMKDMWHDPWSDFSRQDNVMIMTLDILFGFVGVVIIFGFALEELVLITAVLSTMETGGKTLVADFDLTSFDFAKIPDWMDRHSLVVAHATLAALVAIITLVAPFSLVWCRIFRHVGGKGFAKDDAPDEKKKKKRKKKEPEEAAEGALVVSSGPKDDKRKNWTPGDPPKQLILRTLECRNRHTATSLVSSRHLRTETMITNCMPDEVTTRSVAYTRTKMTRLRDQDLCTGPADLRNPDVLHESHTQSTDAPQMPTPEIAKDGNREIVRVARFCERVVQQAFEHVMDNSLIAECFEVAPTNMGDGQALTAQASTVGSGVCCPHQCCKKQQTCNNMQKSFSNVTFFTEEDAKSVNELIETFSTEKVGEDNLGGVEHHDMSFKFVPEPSTRGSSYRNNNNNNNNNNNMQRNNLHHTNHHPQQSPRRSLQQQQQQSRRYRPLDSTSYSSSGDSSKQYVNINIGHHRQQSPDSVAITMPTELIPLPSSKPPRMHRQKNAFQRELSMRLSSNKDKRHIVAPSAKGVPFPSARMPYPSGADDDAAGAPKGDEVEVSGARLAMPGMPHKGPKFKAAAFTFLSVIIFVQLFALTGIKTDAIWFYEEETTGAGTRSTGKSRFHACAFSCVLLILVYLIVGLQLIALLNMIVDRAGNCCGFIIERMLPGKKKQAKPGDMYD